MPAGPDRVSAAETWPPALPDRPRMRDSSIFVQPCAYIKNFASFFCVRTGTPREFRSIECLAKSSALPRLCAAQSVARHALGARPSKCNPNSTTMCPCPRRHRGRSCPHFEGPPECTNVITTLRQTTKVCRELSIREDRLAYMPRASVGLGVASHPSGA
jgi:hypothetical protein